MMHQQVSKLLVLVRNTFRRTCSFGNLALSLLIALLSSCSPTKLYPGPQAAQDQIVEIQVRSGLETQIGKIIINGSELGPFSSRAELLAGTHEIRFRVAGLLEECSTFIENDRCRILKRWYDCQASFLAQAGRKYLILPQGHFYEMSIRIREPGAEKDLLRKTCTLVLQ